MPCDQCSLISPGITFLAESHKLSANPDILKPLSVEFAGIERVFVLCTLVGVVRGQMGPLQPSPTLSSLV